MSKVIDIPGVGNVEFPDEMSDQEISSAISQQTWKQNISRDVADLPAALQEAIKVTKSPKEYLVKGIDPSTGKPNVIQSVLRGGMQGLTFGFGDEASAIINTLGGTPYSQSVAEYRKKNKAAEQANPMAYEAGTLGGALLTGIGGAGKAAVGAGKQILQAAKTGAITGGLYGAGSAEGGVLETGKGALKGAGIGAGLGGGLSTVGAGIGRGLPALMSKVSQPVTPSPAAKYLQSKGVDLTVGQMAPRGAINQLEEAGQSMALTGPVLTAQRGAGKESWQNAVLREVAPSGSRVPESGTIPSKLESIYQSFEKAYRPVKGIDVYPAIHAGGKGVPLGGPQGAFRQAVMDRSALATQDSRKMVDDFLQDQLSIIPKSKGSIGKVSTDSLLQIRSNIRDKIRSFSSGKNTDFETVKLLDNAEKSVTSALESQLPSKSLAALKAADQKYAQYKSVENAIRKAGDMPEGFSPAQLSMAIRESASPGAYARGSGGELRNLASAGRETFDVRSPPTGARVLATGWPLGYVTGTGLALGNLPAGKRLLTGTTGFQKALGNKASLLKKLGPGTQRSFGETIPRGVSALGFLTGQDMTPEEEAAAQIEAIRQRIGR